VFDTLRSKLPLALVALMAIVFASISFASANSIAGTTCKQSGLQQLQDRDLYSCLKVNSKLIWQLTDDNTSSFAPYPISGPTWQQLAEIRDPLAKVTADKQPQQRQS